MCPKDAEHQRDRFSGGCKLNSFSLSFCYSRDSYGRHPNVRWPVLARLLSLSFRAPREQGTISCDVHRSYEIHLQVALRAEAEVQRQGRPISTRVPGVDS